VTGRQAGRVDSSPGLTAAIAGVGIRVGSIGKEVGDAPGSFPVTLKPLLDNLLPKPMARWVLPLWKALHNGKTHLAIALGILACQLRYKVGFYTAAGLVNELTEMEGEKKLSKYQKQWLRYDLVIVDELGYIPFSRRSRNYCFSSFPAVTEEAV